MDNISPILIASYWIVAAYLIGAIPFGFLLTKAARLGDIRDIGSGNTGATNVLRTGNKVLAGATLLLDGAKGGLIVAGAQAFVAPQIVYAVAVVAFLGHIYPIWLNFKGGKGVAIYLGILLALAPQFGAIFVISWLVSATLFRISSLSALIACAVTPVILVLMGAPELAKVTGILSVIAFWTHRANIQRLIQGVEPKIGQK